jgi:hypothetical protein
MEQDQSKTENAAAVRSSDWLGRTGKLRCEDSIIPVKIIAVDEAKKCPKCGGAWGTTQTTEMAMLGGKRIVLKGTTADGCLKDVRLDAAP